MSGAVVNGEPGGYSAATNAQGQYTISGLAPGTYTLTASKPGFESWATAPFVLPAGVSLRVDFRLPPSIYRDLLLNGLFEDGFVSFWGGTIGNSWGAAFRQTASAERAAWFSTSFGGNVGWAQSMRLDHAPNGEVGIAQNVTGLPAGAPFKFSAYAHQTNTGSTNWIGFLANGGPTQLPERTVSFPAVANQWGYREVHGTIPVSGSVTVYLWVWHQSGSAATSSFDNAQLVVQYGTPPATGTIAGAVVTAGVSPVTGASVSIVPGGLSTLSGTDGYFEKLNLQPGDYTVTVTSSDGLFASVPGIAVAAGRTSVVLVQLPGAESTSLAFW